MVFTNEILLGDAKIVINIHDVERVQVTKFLGVIIDHKLKWKYHTAHISGKINKNISVIYKAKKVISFYALKTLYTSLILPYLTYWGVIWGNASKCNPNKVIVLQKRILRIICNSNYSEHTSPLFKRCKLLKLSDLANINILIVMFKVYNNCIPDAKRGYYGFIIVVVRALVRVRRDFLLATYSPHFFPDFCHIWQVA